MSRAIRPRSCEQRPARPRAIRVPEPKAIDDPPGQIDELRALARRDRHMAREQAEALCREGTLEAEIFLLLGMLHLDENAFQPAVEALRRATVLQPNNSVAHFGLGWAYRQMGNIERGRAAFLHARRLLTTIPAATTLADADGMTVEDLRHAVEIQLAELRNPRDGGGADDGFFRRTSVSQ